MTDRTDSDAAKAQRAAEAARILRRLDENPNDPEGLADKQAFLARGAAERRTFALAQRAMRAAVTGLKARDRKKRFAYALLAVLLGTVVLGWEPVSIAIIADHHAGSTAETALLNSGDTSILDAASAIRDQTDQDVRSVALLKGAGFFDVESDGRRFEVTAGDATIEVLGTSFEVARLSNGLRVTVAEGEVQVRRPGVDLVLAAGDQVVLSETGTVQRSVTLDDIARWRQGGLNLSGLTLAEAVSVVDRRMPGRVLIVGEALRSVPLGGTLDLSVARNALETLAAAGNARVVQASPLLTVLYSRQ